MDVNDVFILESIVESCNDIMDAVQKYGSDFKDLEKNKEYQYICAFLLIQIGEYANHLSVKFVHAHPEIPWRNIVDMRNHLTHRYGESSTSTPYIWQTIREDVPLLCKFCKKQIS